MRRTGLALSWLVTLFLLIDGGARLAGFAPYVEGLTKFGYSVALAPWIGLSLLVSTILYAVPRTTVLGAILVTGYLGGAVATQVRVGDPWFLFPAFLGVLTWGGLWCRSSRIRDLLPLMSSMGSDQ
jgi:DoxX-like family